MKARKLPSGNFRVVIVVGTDDNGKRIFKSFTAETEWKAIKMAEDYKQGIEAVAEKGMTVNKAFSLYVSTRSNVIEPTTVRNYHQIAAHCFQCIMDKQVASLTVLDIQKAVNEESARVSPKYVKNAYGLLKSVLKMQGVQLNLESVKLPKLKKQEKELPSFDAVFAVVKGTDSELPALLAAWLSLRIGEVIGLQFRDVDLEKRQINVRRTIVTTEEGYMVRDGCKTEKSVRSIRVPDYILNLIQAQPHEAETDFIVPRTRKSVYSKFKRLMEKNGIDLTFHGLRHLNASIMLMLGIPDKYAMERGGWSTDNILKSVYQQTFSTEREKVDDLIDKYFSGIIRGLEEAENAQI